VEIAVNDSNSSSMANTNRKGGKYVLLPVAGAAKLQSDAAAYLRFFEI